MLTVLLVIAAAPQLTVSPTEVKLDGRVVVSPIPDDEYLNLPALDGAVRDLPQGTQPELRFSVDVTFRVAKRVIFTLASAGRPAKEFFVGELGALALEPHQPTFAFGRVTPTTTPAAVVKALRRGRQQVTGASLGVTDEVHMGRLAKVMIAVREAGITRQMVAPHELTSGPRSNLKPK